MNMKKIAFTLAETLIVIGIIGVVAALTLPNLNHATGDKETVTRVKKIYAALTDAFDRAQAIYGPAEEWFKNPLSDNIYENAQKVNENAAKRILEFMKVSKICGYSDSTCMKKEEQFSDNQQYTVSLADGTALNFAAWHWGDDYCHGNIYVDINGINKGKNKAGMDMFAFEYYPSSGDSGIIPGAKYISDSDENLSDCFNVNYCTEWVVTVGNLDYLKVNSEGKCPNGVQLNWTQTSCE